MVWPCICARAFVSQLPKFTVQDCWALGCLLPVRATAWMSPAYRDLLYKPELQSQEVSALWGQGAPTHSTCFMNLVIILLCDTKDQWKEQCTGTQQFWRYEGQQLCLLFKAQYHTKWWGLVFAMILEPHILAHPAEWWILFWQLLCTNY